VAAQFDSRISVRQLVPPVGGLYHYAAKIEQLCRTTDGAYWRLRMPFAEAWAETEDEARQKAEAMIQRLTADLGTVA